VATLRRDLCRIAAANVPTLPRRTHVILQASRKAQRLRRIGTI
jgi:hypothetical protein